MIGFMLITFFTLLTSNLYATRCVEITPDKGAQLLAKEIEINTQALEETLSIIEENQENPQSELGSISDTIDGINSFIEELIISQTVILKSYDFLDCDQIDDFLLIEELNQLYEQIINTTNSLQTKTTLEELENTLAQLQLEVTLLEAQIADLRAQIENFIFTNEVFLTVAIQEAALLQLQQNAVPGLDFESIFDGVSGFEEAIAKLRKIVDFFCEELCKSKNFFWDKLYKKPQAHKRIRFINFPGIYKIEKNMNNGIIINSDNVIIDLNGHTIYSTDHTPLIIAKNHKNILIKNGNIRGGNGTIDAPAGILINKGAQYVLIDNVTISFCHTAIHCKGEKNAVIQNCTIKNCTFESNNKNIKLNHTIKTSY